MNIKIDNLNVEFEVKRLIDTFHIDEQIDIDLFRDDNNIITKITTKDNKTFVTESMINNDKDAIAYKKSLFKALKSIYPDTVHPWGILTGIRPVKIAHDLIKKSFEENEEPKCWLQISGWYDLGKHTNQENDLPF